MQLFIFFFGQPKSFQSNDSVVILTLWYFMDGWTLTINISWMDMDTHAFGPLMLRAGGSTGVFGPCIVNKVWNYVTHVLNGVQHDNIVFERWQEWKKSTKQISFYKNNHINLVISAKCMSSRLSPFNSTIHRHSEWPKNTLGKNETNNWILCERWVWLGFHHK